MNSRAFKIGDKLMLRKHTLLWAQEHVQGRSDFVYEVVGIVSDGFERITVRHEAAVDPTWIGIDAQQFEAWGGGDG